MRLADPNHKLVPDPSLILPTHTSLVPLPALPSFLTLFPRLFPSHCVSVPAVFSV